MARNNRSWRKFQDLRVSAKAGISKRVRKIEGVTLEHARQFILNRWNHVYEVRRNIGIWLCGVGVLIFIMVAHMILLRSSYTEVASVRGGTYAEGLVSDITTLNPIYATTTAEVSASRLMFSSLFRYDDTGSLSGDVATGYKVDETGKIYTVTTHQNATWHDGNPLTIDDIIFTLDTLKKPAASVPQADNWRNIEYKKINDTTLEFILPSPYTPFPNALTFAILPKHILGDVPAHSLRENKFSNSPVGSGPFVFNLLQRSKSEKRHVVLHAARNSKYYKGVPKLERFQLHAYGDNEMLIDALKKQAINAAADVSADSFNELLHDPRFTGYTPAVNSGVYALFNTESESLSNVDVRRALRYGLSTKSVREGLGHNPQPIDLPVLKSQVDGLEEVKVPQYNQDKANDILDKAGWVRDISGVRKKDGQNLMVRMSLKKDPEYERVANNIANQWRSLGADVQLNIIDTSDPTQNFASLVLQPRDYDVLIYELAIGADPDVYAYWHSSQATARGLNFSNYRDGLVDDSLDGGRSRANDNLRDAKYKTFVTRWSQQVPAIGLYRSPSLYVARKGAYAVESDMHFVISADRYYNVLRWTTRVDSVYKTP